MASGSRKKKQKFVLAKDPKQALGAIIVIAIFIINGIVIGVKTYQEEYGSGNTTSQAGGIPFVPILAVLLVGLVFGGIVFMIKNKKPSATSEYDTAMKEVSNDRKKPKKGGLEIAKNPKQALGAILVMLIFIGNGIYLGVKYYQDEYGSSNANNPEAEQMAAQQQQNLKNLANGQAPSPDIAQDANNIYNQTMDIQGNQGGPQPQQNPQDPSMAVPPSADNNVEIIASGKGIKKSGKTVMITVSNSGRTNPFLPAAENYTPQTNSYFSAPPETLPSDSEAGKVMTTTISGILYDKYSPSAILNIEGSDYLVKRGDIINKYKILSITRNEVLVQLGKNVYKAGVGELLSKTDINFNTIANLEKKFGGNNVSIHVKKKGY